jgi:hypothetical protein
MKKCHYLHEHLAGYSNAIAINTIVRIRLTDKGLRTFR